MSGTPAALVNRALDQIGRPDLEIGDLGEGSEGSKPALRAYLPCLKQLLRGAHWGFARKMAPLQILGDATGQTPNTSRTVQAPWAYAYEYPIDAVKLRFLPWNSNPQTPTPPLTTAFSQPPLNSIRLRPCPFLESTDYNYPVTTGAGPPGPTGPTGLPSWAYTEGTGPVQRTVILTNAAPQPQGTNPTLMPQIVYTALIYYPSQWDSLFDAAYVNFLAQHLAMPLVKDKRLARTIRGDAIAIVKASLSEARAMSANESGYPQTTDHTPDWIRARNAGGGCGYPGGSAWGAGYSGPGCLWGAWDSCAFSDGSVF